MLELVTLNSARTIRTLLPRPTLESLPDSEVEAQRHKNIRDI